MSRALPSPDDLKPMLDRAAGEYRAHKQDAEGRVARWVWASGPVRPLRPGFDDLIVGFARGKELPGEPKKRGGAFEYGLDASDRPVVVRLHSDPPGHFAETFLAYHDDHVDEWSYAPHPQYKDPRGVAVYLREGGRVTGYSNLNADGRTQVETYTYEDGRLKTLRRVTTKPDLGVTYEHAYDPAGDLVNITMRRDDGKGGVVWQRPARTPAVLLKAVRARLAALIPEKVAALAPAEPAFALALVYDPGSALSMLPPKLAVGLEGERERWRKSGAAKEALWDAQGFASFDDDRLELDDAALLADTRELAEHLRSAEGMEKARKLLVDLAKDLDKADLGARLRVTPDFVVYPVDLQTANLAADLAAAVPAAKLKKLKARGEA